MGESVLSLRRCCLYGSVWVFLGAVFLEPALSCDLSPLRVPEIQGALQRKECRESEYLSEVPNLGNYNIKSLDIVFEDTESEFRGRPRTAKKIRQLLNVDGDWIRAQHRQLALSNKPTGCDDVDLSNFAYRVVDGKLEASFQVDYQKMTCTHGTCYKGMSDTLIPYPIFGKCEWKTNVPGASATLVVHSVMSPRLGNLGGDSAAVELDIRHWVEEKKGVSNLLKNIVGALTLGIGSKYIQDQYGHAIDDFKSTLRPEVVSLVDLPRIRRTNSQVSFELQAPFFDEAGGALGFVVVAETIQSQAVACEVRSSSVQAQRFFQSCIDPQLTYTTQAGDTLWGIAERVYGDGQYYHVIAQENGLVSDKQQMLQPEQELRLRPYFELVDPDSELVEAGNTLWEIAEKRLGDGKRYAELLKANPTLAGQERSLPSLTTLVIPK